MEEFQVHHNTSFQHLTRPNCIILYHFVLKFSTTTKVCCPEYKYLNVSLRLPFGTIKNSTITTIIINNWKSSRYSWPHNEDCMQPAIIPNPWSATCEQTSQLGPCVNGPHTWGQVWTGHTFQQGVKSPHSEGQVWTGRTVQSCVNRALTLQLGTRGGRGGGRGPEEAAAAAAELMRSFCRGVWCSAWCHNVFNVGDMTRWVLLLQLQYPHWLLSIFFIKITQNHCRFCRWPISGGIGSCWAAETASRGHVVAFESLICVDKKATSSRVNQPRSSFRCSHGHGGNVFVCLPSGCDHGGLKLSFTTLQKPLTD